jgi:glycosyltransferase involved in cell wall biosynthesis
VPSLTIVIPAFNEERRLPAALDRIREYLRQSPRFTPVEIIVVDDGSSDGTAAFVESYGQQHGGVRLLRNPGNRGKGYAVRNGMLSAQGEWVLFSDADLSAPIEEVEKLFDASISEGAPVAIGSRALKRELIEVRQSIGREMSGRAFNAFMRLLTGLTIYDTQCGFKLYRRDAAQAIFQRQRLEGFSFDVEDMVIAKQLGLKVVEVPVRWSNVEGTKVALSHGMRAFIDVLIIRKQQLAGLYR